MTAPLIPKKSHGPPDVLMWLMPRPLLVRWTFSFLAMAMVYRAPAPPISVAVTLGMKRASWQAVRTASVIVEKTVELNISIDVKMEISRI